MHRHVCQRHRTAACILFLVSVVVEAVCNEWICQGENSDVSRARRTDSANFSRCFTVIFTAVKNRCWQTAVALPTPPQTGCSPLCEQIFGDSITYDCDQKHWRICNRCGNEIFKFTEVLTKILWDYLPYDARIKEITSVTIISVSKSW